LYEAGTEKLGTGAQIDINLDQLEDIELKEKRGKSKKQVDRCQRIYP
jgi:hypothetical protein